MTLEEQLKSMKISRQKLAKDIHVPVSLVNAVIKGEEAITVDMALRLGRYFGNGPEVWLKLALEDTAKRLKDELALIPQLTTVPKTKEEQKGEERTKEQIKKWKEWLNKMIQSYAKKAYNAYEKDLSLVKAADFSKPTDEVARAAVSIGDIDAIRKLAAAGYKRWCVKEIGWGAFHTPCVDVVRFIVESGFDITEIGHSYGNHRHE